MNNLLVMIVLLFTSCSNESKINKDILKLMSNPISLPCNATITVNGKDSLIKDYFESNYKMIIYTDSLECTSCEISNMRLWKPFLTYADSLKGKLNFYFIFSTSKSKSVRYALMNNSFRFPALIDEKGEFEKLNPHLPSNKTMHTFLLDDNNNVIMIGNPLYNNGIEKLFYQEMQKLMSP